MNRLIYPLKKVAITQTYNGEASHKPHTTGLPKDYPIDDNGGDSSRSAYFYCPCDEIVIVRVYGVGASGTNTIFMRSTSPVQFANGEKDYACILVTHPDDDTLKGFKEGQKFSRKQPMFIEGKDGQATGYHFHISVGKGDFIDKGWVKNSKDKWVLNTTNGSLKPEDAFFIDEEFTEIVDKKKLKFKSLPVPEVTAPAPAETTPDSAEQPAVNTTTEDLDVDPDIDPARSYTRSKAGTYVVVPDVGLRLRTGASTKEEILGVMPKGTKVRCYGYHTENWLFVVWGNVVGFCSAEYLRKVK